MFLPCLGYCHRCRKQQTLRFSSKICDKMDQGANDFMLANVVLYVTSKTFFKSIKNMLGRYEIHD